MDLISIALSLTSAFFSAFLAVWWLSQRQLRPIQPALDDRQSLLFDNGLLHHGTQEALERFSFDIGHQTWKDFCSALADQLPGLSDWSPSDTQRKQEFLSAPGASALRAIVSQDGTRTRVVLLDHINPKEREKDRDGPELQELQTLKDVFRSTPYPIWKTNDRGKVIWHNAAYEVLLRQVKPRSRDWSVPFIEVSQSDGPQRVALPAIGSDQPDWYSVSRSLVDNHTIYHAIPANELVIAEKTQSTFVQTLAKTFAHLSTGLAIFDRDKQLVLFNPALFDLTNLSAEFLSSRPTMDSFFDGLRDNRKMPEPKNYAKWRQDLSDAVHAANGGHFQETWTLDSGQTYRVSGKPHPDGATAFLIEDISAEIMLTRSFRAELEQGQYLLDMLDDGLVVFSQTGVLTFSNAAYSRMWGVAPETSFVDITITDSIRLWKEKTSPNPMWQELEDFVLSFGQREAWDMPIQIEGAPPTTCQVVPILSGATMIRFDSPKLLNNSSKKSASTEN